VEARGISKEDAAKVRSRTNKSQWALGDTEQRLEKWAAKL
jgi:sterol carrier protein 2